MELNVIYARARNGVIGNGQGMPWHIPEDMAHFRRLTLGCVVIMGRKTWDSLPGPLAGRVSIVITRDPHLERYGRTAYQAGSVKEALEIAQRVIAMKGAQGVWVIGGAEIYKQTLPLATRVVVTEIHQDYMGDTYLPKLGRRWREVSRQDALSAGTRLSFVSYERRKPLFQGPNKLFVKLGRYLAIGSVVTLVAWSPVIFAAYAPSALTEATFMLMCLATLGAITAIQMVERFARFTVSHFRSTNRNPKE
jgi:dihydrofolate reductase